MKVKSSDSRKVKQVRKVRSRKELRVYDKKAS